MDELQRLTADPAAAFHGAWQWALLSMLAVWGRPHADCWEWGLKEWHVGPMPTGISAGAEAPTASLSLDLRSVTCVCSNTLNTAQAREDGPGLEAARSVWDCMPCAQVMWLVAEAEALFANGSSSLDLQLSVDLARLQSVAYCWHGNVEDWSCARCAIFCTIPLGHLCVWRGPSGVLPLQERLTRETCALLPNCFACTKKGTARLDSTQLAAHAAPLHGYIYLHAKAWVERQVAAPCARRCQGHAAQGFQPERVVYDESWDLFGYAGW